MSARCCAAKARSSCPRCCSARSTRWWSGAGWRRSGFPDGEQLVLGLVRFRAEPADYEAVADALAHADFPHLVLRQQDALCVLIPGTPAAQQRLAALPGVVAGLSRPFTAGVSLVIARREAQWALSRAAAGGRVLASYDEDQIARWLTSDQTDLQVLVGDVLGEAISYDREHGAEIVPTLRTWLERGRGRRRRPRRCTSTRTRCCTGSGGSRRSAGGRWPRPRVWLRCGWHCGPPRPWTSWRVARVARVTQAGRRGSTRRKCCSSWPTRSRPATGAR